MFRRCRPLVCSTAIGVSFGAQHPTGRTACVGCTASPNRMASSSPSWFRRFSYPLITAACLSSELPITVRNRGDRRADFAWECGADARPNCPEVISGNGGPPTELGHDGGLVPAEIKSLPQSFPKWRLVTGLLGTGPLRRSGDLGPVYYALVLAR